MSFKLPMRNDRTIGRVSECVSPVSSIYGNKITISKISTWRKIMFDFGKKQDNDPKKALEKADNVLNKGMMGALTKGFMGKDFVDKMNNALDQGNAAINMTEQSQWAG